MQKFFLLFSSFKKKNKEIYQKKNREKFEKFEKFSS